MSDLSAVTSRLPRAAAMTTINVDGRPFRCSTDMAEHCLSVFRGEYDPGPLEFSTPPRVLDIGANYGSFAVWAASTWKGAVIHCYEPHPATFDALCENMLDALCENMLDARREDMRGDVSAHRRAVRATAGKAFLRFGKNNEGEASFYDLGEQREDGVEVECIAASELPDCDVLKIDTEGCEVEIVESYVTKMSTRPAAVMLEFHSESDRRLIEERMWTWGYTLVRGTIRSADRGVLCYVRRI